MSGTTKNSNLDGPLMPKAVALWLIDNTSLTFRQIAAFCNLLDVEVQSIADDELFPGMVAWNPVVMGEISQEEIDLCEVDPNRMPKLCTKYKYGKTKKSKSHYVPVSRRKDKPDAIFWLLKNCPDLAEAQIISLIGTTKSTIASIRERTHWNMGNIKPRDPVLLELCSQSALDEEVLKASILAEKRARKSKMEQSTDELVSMKVDRDENSLM